MRTLTVRLPDALAAEIEAESRGRKISKSDVVRERLGSNTGSHRRDVLPDAIADLVGAVDKLPVDLSERKREFLKRTRYGRKLAR